MKRHNEISLLGMPLGLFYPLSFLTYKEARWKKRADILIKQNFSTVSRKFLGLPAKRVKRCKKLPILPWETGK